MSARMNYIMVPVDYIRGLRHSGVRGRVKARAFMEYFDDLELGDHHSVGFYATSWDVSKSTAHDWLKDFRHETDRFLNYWILKNEQHYTHAKNQTERNERFKPNEMNDNKRQNIGVCETPTERNERQQPNEVFNSNVVVAREDNYMTDMEFSDLCFIYSMNGGTVGKKMEVYEIYKRVNVDPDSLKMAAMEYLHSDVFKGYYNLKNFLSNDTYLKHMPKRVSINYDGKWIDMDYNSDNGELIADNGAKGSLNAKAMMQKYKDGSLKFIKPTGKAA